MPAEALELFPRRVDHGPSSWTSGARKAEQLARLAAGGRGGGVPGEHARQFADPLLALDALDDGPRASALLELGDAELPIGLAGDDREVRDAQDLADAAEPGEPLADGAGDRAADAGVYFIEQQSGNAVLAHGERAQGAA